MPGLDPLLSGLAWVDKVHGLDSTGFSQDLSNRSSDWSPSHALPGYGFRRTDEGVSALALRQAGRAPRGGLSGPASFVVGPAPGDGVRPAVGLALVARGGRCAGALSGRPRPSGIAAGAAVHPCGCQPGSSGGPVRGRAGSSGRPAGRVFGPARAGDAAPRRRDPGPGRQADRELGGRRRRQAARGLRPWRRRARLLCRDPGQGQRHHPGQALPHRARRDLRLRQGLLRLRLLGSPRCRGVPLRHPPEEELAHTPDRDPSGRPGGPGPWPTASPCSRSVWQEAARTPSTSRCA